jgi:hypothetical protein
LTSDVATASACPRSASGRSSGELVAAQTGEHVGLTDAVAYRRRQAAQHVVARRVPEAVVHRLEAVEVHQHHGAARPVASVPGDLLAELLLEPSAVNSPAAGRGDLELMREV